MKLFRNPGLMIAVFWCTAMVMAPIAAAAGAGQSTNQGIDQVPGPQGMNPGQAYQDNNRMQQGQENGQNNAGPVQGNGLQGMGRGNVTGLRNRTLITPADGNMTPPRGMPAWDPGNSTALNKTAWHDHRAGNMTGVNLTNIPPPLEWDPANMTAANQTWRGHGDGNATMPAPPQQGNVPGQDQKEGQQPATGKNNVTSDLLAELIAWLKAYTGS